MRYLLVPLICLFNTSLPLSAQTSITPEDFLVDENILVAQLPERLMGRELDIPQGTLTYAFDAANGRLRYQYAGEDTIESILLPLHFNMDNDNEVRLASDGLSITICNYKYTSGVFESSVRGEMYSVDFSNDTIKYAGECYYDLPEWGEPGVSYSGKVLSPDGEYTVSIAESAEAEGCINEIPNLYSFAKYLMVESQLTSKRTACILADGIHFEEWVDNRHLVIRLFAPRELTAPISQLLILSVESAELLSLGTQYEHPFSPEMYFFDNNTRLARIAIRDENRLKPEHNCALNIVDFNSLSETDIEATTCIHRPEIMIDEQNRELTYLHHTVQDNPFRPHISLHRVDLDTNSVTLMNISGSLIDIEQMSPTGNKLTLVVDQGDTYWYAVQGVVEYDNPRWVVYDMLNDEPVYETPLLEINGRYDRSLDSDHIGAEGFIWTDTGWRTLLLTDKQDQPPLYIASENGIITETRLEQIPPSAGYFTYWSPDQSQLLLKTDTNAAYLLNVADMTFKQMFQPFDLGELWLSIEWQGDLLMVEIYERGGIITQGRWLIDPAQ